MNSRLRKGRGICLAVVAATITACAVPTPGQPTGLYQGNPASSLASDTTATAGMVRLAGRIRATGEATLPPLRVTVRPRMAAPDARVYTTWADTSGNFGLDVPDGVYNLTVDGVPGYRAIRFEVQAATQIDVDLVPTGSLSGQVTASRETPLEGLLVFVPGTDLVAHADAQGGFVMRDVPVGNYNLVAGLPGALATRIGPAAVTAGTETKLAPVALARPELSVTDVVPMFAAPGSIIRLNGKGFGPGLRLYDSTGRRILDWELIDTDELTLRLPSILDGDRIAIVLDGPGGIVTTSELTILRPYQGGAPFRVVAGVPRWTEAPPAGQPLPADVGIVGQPFGGARLDPLAPGLTIGSLLQADLDWDFQGPGGLTYHDEVEGSYRFIASQPGTYEIAYSAGNLVATRSFRVAKVLEVTGFPSPGTLLPEGTASQPASPQATSSEPDLFPGLDEPVDGTGGGTILTGGAPASSSGLVLPAWVQTTEGTVSAVVWESLNPALVDIRVVDGAWRAFPVGTEAVSVDLKVSSWDDPAVSATTSVRVDPSGNLTAEVR